MDFKEVVQGRYSCKKFSEKSIEPEKLQSILEAGRLAPTAKNLQEQHIYVLQSPKALGIVDAHTPCRYGAGTVLAVAYNKETVFTYPGGLHTSGVDDATIVATHLALAAYNEGIDSCWLNFFDPEALAKALDLPETEEIVMLLDLGYAADGVSPLPNHTHRKPLSETVTYL